MKTSFDTSSLMGFILLVQQIDNHVKCCLSADQQCVFREVKYLLTSC